MLLQNAVSTTIALGVESAWGTKPAANSGALIRRVSSNLALGKDAYTSNEARSDMQINDARHGTRRPGGQIEGELSRTTYDPFIEAVQRGTWTVGVSATNTALTSVVSDAASKTFTFGGGSLITAGFRVGDVVRFTGLAATANNGKNFTILALTATVMTVAETVVTDATPDNTFTVAVVGAKVLNGIVKRSFTLEQHYPDIDVSEVFTGWRWGSMGIGVPANGITTVTFGGLGRDTEVLKNAAAPYFANPTAETTTSLLAGPTGALFLGTSQIAVVTAMDITVDLGLEAPAVVGTDLVPEIFYGRTMVSGNVTVLFEGDTVLQGFIDEMEFAVGLSLFEAEAEPRDFLRFFMPRVKLTGSSKTIGATGGVPISFPFQALRGNATGADATTLSVQRSA